jgi:hypothetical protein
MRLPALNTHARELDRFESARRQLEDMFAAIGRCRVMDWAAPSKMGLAPLDIAESENAIEFSTELPCVVASDMTFR